MLEGLLRAGSYREFLSHLMRHPERGRPISYAELARRAGFSSRSFPADVISGHRRVTAASLPQFIRGLNLKGDLRNYFSLLVALEEPDVNPDRLSIGEIEKALLKLRSRLEARAVQPQSMTPSRVYGSEHWIDVYASLGRPEIGSTVADVAARTKLSMKICEDALKGMATNGAVVFKSDVGRYFTISPHLVFDRLGGETYFQKHYLATLAKMSRHASGAAFKDPTNWFFTSVFSIDKKRASEFKDRLRQLVLEFVESSEEPDGDSLAKLAIGFLTNE